MATAKQCSECAKESGPFHCTGCDKYFCWKDFKKHREQMSNIMEQVIEERNQLQETINIEIQSDIQSNSIIQQIDSWQENIITKVKQVADKARIQATELLNSKRTKINTEFTTFSQGLASLKETENYVEHELTELNEKIAQFKLDLEDTVRPAGIKVHTELSETIDWENMIYVDQEQTLAKNSTTTAI